MSYNAFSRRECPKQLFKSYMSHLWSTSLAASLVVGLAAIGSATVAIAPSQAETASFETLADADYWTSLCRLQADAGNYSEAQAACEQAIALSPEDANIWAQHSGILVNLEAFPEAIASADRALAFNDKHSLAIAYQCVAYSALADTERALDKCNQALRVNGSWGTQSPALAWLHRGTILAQAEQYDLALVAFERTLLLAPDDSLALTRQCETYLALERSRDALRTCTAALAGNQHWGNSAPALAWTYRGRAHAQLSQYDQAIAAYDRAIGLDPNNAATWAAHGQILAALRRDPEALVSYERAVAIKSDYARALLGQCTLLNRLKSYEAALASCDAAIEGDGDWDSKPLAIALAKSWNERSIALTGLAQYEEALASINRATGIQPDYVAAHNHRSTILWYLERYPQALAANQQALDLDDTYAPAWFTRGVILRAMGDFAGAIAAYDQGLALNPFNAWGWTNRSALLWQMEDYEAALASAESAIALEPQSVSALYNQGAALSALGQYWGAIAAYSQVLELDATHTDALTGRGIARLHLKDYEGASADLQAALALNSEDLLAQTVLDSLPDRSQPD